jgi:hypothetical protein
MKKWLVVVIVLSLGGAANAGLLISVDGQVDPPNPAIALTSGQTANIGIWSDGGLPADGVGYLVVSGPAAADIAGASHYVSEKLIYVVGSGPFEGAVGFDLKEADTGNSPFLPGGTLVDNITLGSNGTGQIDLELWFDETSAGGQLQLMDTQVFNMVPEPMTMVLLGLGALFLRHRKR